MQDLVPFSAPYYVSALAYYRIEQFFRSGDLKSEYKKARFHLLYIVRLIATGENLPPFNNKKIESLCEDLKQTLIKENLALSVFQKAQVIFETSGLDLSKKQYKSESETEILLAAYKSHNNSMQPNANVSAD